MRIKTNKTLINNLLNKDTEQDQKITTNKNQINKLENALKTIRQELNDQEQYTRRTMCVVKGIPYKTGEDTDKIISSIINKLELPIKDSDIDISHRQRNDENAGIIVKFVNRKSRNEFYNGRKKLRENKITTKSIDYTEDQPIYINESLTQLNGEIFRHARHRLLGTGRMKWVWTSSNGVIKASRGEGMKKHIIKNKEDVAKLELNNKPMTQQNEQS